ncbi:hypothetical protein W97_06931 [Coniosporium apollinis CBS 100218]|uniref:Uncharacterized protein n=1 Tax=Coniosporium apollinis (strain CBS 100218) TaxID=1168221 RepID=R7Z0F7_CONA1|nr:uncharacterized protein W97_06931 [Coniosporium apollinis CBS 100218]EON67563.1 hypothetical protein W97_06931 [Coniosporium apollinis CBS 100218]
MIQRDIFGEGTLYQSRWAPKHLRVSASAAHSSNNGAPTGTSRSSSPRKDDLHKIQRLISRLSWKSDLLLASQARALSDDATAVKDAADSHTSPITMFKLDFFEYYVLLERILVLLLAFFNVRISRDQHGAETEKKDGAPQTQPLYWGHRFHANVLEAFEKPSSPLHECLGKGQVMAYLAMAKASRNRWKDADEQHPTLLEEESNVFGPQLEEILRSILEALKQSWQLAESKTAEAAPRVNGKAAAASLTHDEAFDMELDNAPWETVGDAMDWDEI